MIIHLLETCMIMFKVFLLLLTFCVSVFVSLELVDLLKKWIVGAIKWIKNKTSEEKIQANWEGNFMIDHLVRDINLARDALNISAAETQLWMETHPTDQIELTSNFKDYLILKDGKAFWETRSVKEPEVPEEHNNPLLPADDGIPEVIEILDTSFLDFTTYTRKTTIRRSGGSRDGLGLGIHRPWD